MCQMSWGNRATGDLKLVNFSYFQLELYNSYSGNKDELSKPDQFMYELSRVPGFEMRLKAILFKANFDEKVDELKQVMSGGCR